MSFPVLTRAELLRRHFIVAATVANWLRPEWTGAVAWSRAASHYRELRPAVRRTTLNDEPAYTAGEIAGISELEIDAQPPEFWEKYDKVRFGACANPDEFSGRRGVPDLGSLT